MTTPKEKIRSTSFRRSLLELLSGDRAWTAVQVKKALKHSDLSTVYRNINKLAELKVITEAPVSGSESRYEMAGKSHHAHLVCKSCNGAFCVPCPLGKVRSQHNLEFIDLCKSCQAKLKKASR